MIKVYCELKFVFNACRPQDGKVNLHKHDCHEIVFYTRGLGNTSINGKTYVLKTGMVAIIEPLSWHDEQHYENTDVICIGVQYEKSDLKLSEGVFPVDCYKSLVRLAGDILNEASSQKDHFQQMLECKLGELTIELSRMHSSSDRKCKDLTYVVNSIKENYSQQIDLPSLAGLCGYSYDYFRHMFKIKTGMSPQNYLMNERLCASEFLLMNTSMKLTEIALVCGFSNSSQFSMIFKEKYKKSPKAFRLEKRNTNKPSGSVS